MTQKTSPFLEGKYGWNYGVSGGAGATANPGVGSSGTASSFGAFLTANGGGGRTVVAGVAGAAGLVFVSY